MALSIREGWLTAFRSADVIIGSILAARHFVNVMLGNDSHTPNLSRSPSRNRDAEVARESRRSPERAGMILGSR
jgi:hypothetical protein